MEYQPTEDESKDSANDENTNKEETEFPPFQFVENPQAVTMLHPDLPPSF